MTNTFVAPVSARSSRVSRTVVPFEDRSGLVRMDRNEDVTGWEEERLREVLGRLGPADLAAYHDADDVQARIASWLGFDSTNISITAGSSEAVQLVFETYLDEGGLALALEPSYGLYEVFAAKCGGRLEGVTFDEHLNVDVEVLVARIIEESPTLVVIANPNQPTGTILDEVKLQRLAEATKSVGAVLLVDEAYCLFTPVTALGLIHEFPNVIVTQTFSKAMGLAGLRLGYCVGARERILEINRLRPLTQSNAVALAVADYLLDNLDWALDRVKATVEGREFLVSSFRDFGLVTFDSHANFVLLGCISLEGAEALIAEARSRGYAIRGPLRGFPLENFVRVTVASKPIMEAFVSDNEGSIRAHGRLSES